MARSSTFVALILLAHNIQRTAGHGAMLTPTPRNAIDSTIPGMDWGNGTTKTGKMEPLSVQVDLLSLLSAPPLPRAPCSFTSRTPFHYMYPLLFDGGRARAHLLCYPFDPIVRASFTAPLTHCSPCSRSPCSLPLLTAPLARSAPT